jgi:hypothetical protein
MNSTTTVRDYADYSDVKLRAAYELFSTPTLDALGDVDVNGITVDADMRAQIMNEQHTRALALHTLHTPRAMLYCGKLGRDVESCPADATGCPTC